MFNHQQFREKITYGKAIIGLTRDNTGRQSWCPLDDMDHAGRFYQACAKSDMFCVVLRGRSDSFFEVIFAHYKGGYLNKNNEKKKAVNSDD